jgi:diguanylate cyclase (GGDEF)-like protein
LNALTEFSRLTQARWLWPSLLVLALIELLLLLVALAASGDHADAGVATLEVMLTLTALLGTALIVYRLVRTANQALTQALVIEQQVREAVDAMPAGFAIYDQRDRLIVCNQMVTDIFPHLKGRTIIGKTYEQLLRDALRTGAPLPVPADQFEDWLANTLAQRRSHNTPTLRSVPDGRWFHHYERLTASQHLVVIRLDVTELVHKSDALERANDKLARLSTTDGLTGIANRRLFDQTLQKEWQRSARGQQPLALLLIDIDHFKRYNDLYGHLQGDEALRQVAQALERCVRRSGELVARYGGEEFALLLPGADAAQAAAVARQCADEIALCQIAHAGQDVTAESAPSAESSESSESSEPRWLTLSIGVAATVAQPDELPELLIKMADVALYRAKASGRARVVLA